MVRLYPAARQGVHKGWENVNREHLWWPSWQTLRTLLVLAGYAVEEFFWYHGNGPTSEGLIFVARPGGEDGE